MVTSSLRSAPLYHTVINYTNNIFAEILLATSMVLYWVLTQYHQVPTSTTLNCSITTKYQSVSPYTDQIPSFINQYRPILTQYQQVPTCITLYNSSSCNAQLSQLDGFSFCDSFDESRSVFGPVFSYFSCSVFFFSKKKYIFLIHFSSAPPKKILPQILSKDQ